MVLQSRKKYCVFGLQRSGTNFLEQHIITGMPDCQLVNSYDMNGLWKHTYDINFDIKTKRAKTGRSNKLETYDYWISRLRETNAVLVHKHPYMWVESIYKLRLHLKNRAAIAGVRLHPDYVPPSEGKLACLEGLCKIYKKHQEFWKEQSRHQRIYRVAYENLLMPGNAKMHTRFIADFFDDEFIPFEHEIIKVPLSNKFTDDDRNKYLKYETSLDYVDKKMIRELLGSECFEYYGYQI